VQTTPSLLFRKLLAQAPRGTPLSTAWLGERGLRAQQVARLAQSGWLQRLGRGAYLLPGDELNRDAALAWLASQVPGLHVAGATALAWRGVRHNLAFKERLVLWGDKPTRLPAWFTAAFPATYQATHLFGKGMPPSLGLAPLPAGRADLPVSTPERAMLELLSDVGKRHSLEQARQLVEGLRSLRPDVLQELLGQLQRIKVARLAHALAEELDLPWKTMAREHSERLGGGKRWVSATRTGERLNLKRPP
jgi:Transcriptional regulator, AbiEi antitoxin, Type IV TA system/Transcriptional regulator, AbiEi antitoxin N-terminal domain